MKQSPGMVRIRAGSARSSRWNSCIRNVTVALQSRADPVGSGPWHARAHGRAVSAADVRHSSVWAPTAIYLLLGGIAIFGTNDSATGSWLAAAFSWKNVSAGQWGDRIGQVNVFRSASSRAGDAARDRRGWTVREVRGGTAVLEGPDGIQTGSAGDKIPGGGRIG